MFKKQALNQLRLFNQVALLNNLSMLEKALYHELFNLFNKSFWADEISISDKDLIRQLNFTNAKGKLVKPCAIYRAKKKLEKAGVVKIVAGNGKTHATSYELIEMKEQDNGVISFVDLSADLPADLPVDLRSYGFFRATYRKKAPLKKSVVDLSADLPVDLPETNESTNPHNNNAAAAPNTKHLTHNTLKKEERACAFFSEKKVNVTKDATGNVTEKNDNATPENATSNIQTSTTENNPITSDNEMKEKCSNANITATIEQSPTSNSEIVKKNEDKTKTKTESQTPTTQSESVHTSANSENLPAEISETIKQAWLQNNGSKLVPATTEALIKLEHKYGTKQLIEKIKVAATKNNWDKYPHLTIDFLILTIENPIASKGWHKNARNKRNTAKHSAVSTNTSNANENNHADSADKNANAAKKPKPTLEELREQFAKFLAS